MSDTLSAIVSWLVEHGTRIGLIALIGFVVYYIINRAMPRAVRGVMATHMRRKPEEEIEKRAKTLSDVFVKTGLVMIIIGAAFTVLSDLGINIGPALAGVGVVGLAVGFGAQTLVKDLIAGLMILMENQYGVGDVVRIAGIAGLVESVDIRKTVLRDLDGIVHYVPNGEIRVTSNLTKEWSRVNMNVSVAYKEDLDRVIAVINRVGQEMAADPAWSPFIISAPKVLRVDSLGESGIEIKILGDTKPIKQWDVMGELRRRLKKTFDQEGIEIPWPHTKVYFGDHLEVKGKNTGGLPEKPG